METESVREKMFTMRMSAEEWAALEALCSYYGATSADVVRLALAKESAAVKPPAAKRLRITGDHVLVVQLLATHEKAHNGDLMPAHALLQRLGEHELEQKPARIFEELRTAGLIERRAGLHALTDAGRALAKKGAP